MSGRWACKTGLNIWKYSHSLTRTAMLSLYLALWRLIALVNTQHWEMLDAGFQVVCCKVGTSISEHPNYLPQSRSRPIIVLPQTWRELQPDFLFLGVFCRNMFQLPCRPYFLALAEHTTESNDKKFSASCTLKVHTIHCLPIYRFLLQRFNKKLGWFTRR